MSGSKQPLPFFCFSTMWARLLFLLCIAIHYIHAYEEIIPTATFELAERGGAYQCHRFCVEVYVNNGRRCIGFLSFDGESHASVSRDQSVANVLRFDSDGGLKTQKSYVGLRNLNYARGFQALGLMKDKPTSTWNEDLTYDDAAFCYSRSQNIIYGHQNVQGRSPPKGFKCNPVTFDKKCGKCRHLSGLR